MTLAETTPAKVNLFLHVLGARTDGYHELVSVVLPLTRPADLVRLDVMQEPGLKIACDHPGVPEDAGNLCWRAAQAFAAAVPCEPRWQVAITKSIPVAAGLGGGSSDAAALLSMLNRSQDSPLSPEHLHALAAALGADVPFFLNPVPALATGIGDQLDALACGASVPLVLVNPGFPVSAAWAYDHLDRVVCPPPPAAEQMLEALTAGDLESLAACTWNRLEFGICDKFPLVQMILEHLLDNGCLAAHVCGSGPTVYGVCRPGEESAVLHSVRQAFGDVWARTAAAGALQPEAC